MIGENIRQEFTLKNLGEKKNYFNKGINQNELISKRHKKVSTTWNYIENLLILASAVTGCVSIFAFASLFGMPVGIASSAVLLKINVTTAGIKSISQYLRKRRRNMKN